MTLKLCKAAFLVLFLSACTGEEPVFRDTRAGCKKREACESAVQDCVAGTVLFREMFSLCKDYDANKNSSPSLILWQICDPVGITITCADAHRYCDRRCDEAHSL
ncbi:MAG: hypothetical protein HS115_10940 [Spirochaetales bacterium]|nr:hypothetical protein [Spirochaetales bacterium]